jgi:hypothetical protein
MRELWGRHRPFLHARAQLGQRAGCDAAVRTARMGGRCRQKACAHKHLEASPHRRSPNSHSVQADFLRQRVFAPAHGAAPRAARWRDDGECVRGVPVGLKDAITYTKNISVRIQTSKCSFHCDFVSGSPEGCGLSSQGLCRPLTARGDEAIGVLIGLNPADRSGDTRASGGRQERVYECAMKAVMIRADEKF